MTAVAKRFRGSSGYINGVCFSPDGRMALAGSTTGMVWLWDAASYPIWMCNQVASWC